VVSTLGFEYVITYNITVAALPAATTEEYSSRKPLASGG